MIRFDRVPDYTPVPEQLADLPAAIRQQAVRAYRIFRNDPSYPSLHFKKVEGEENIYSVRIGIGYRALGVWKGDRILWFWIGSHAQYDRQV